MAYSFPLDLATFFDTLVLSTGDFRLNDPRKFSITEDGSVIDMARGARRWEGSVTMVDGRNDGDSSSVDALLSLLTTPGASFLMYDTRRKFPKYDPTGQILGAASVAILSNNANRKDIALKGLPVGYRITRGDHLSFQYVDVTGKTQWSLHQVVSPQVIAGGTGNTAQFEIVPHLPRGITVTNLPVALTSPSCKVVLAPGKTKYSVGRPGVHSNGQSFDFIQTKV